MRAAALLAALAACGGRGDPTPVIVHAGSAILVAVDPWGDGHWERIAPNAVVTLDMGPRWIATSACGSADNVWVRMAAYRAEDSDDVVLPCQGTNDLPVFVPVAGPDPAVERAYYVLGPDGYGDNNEGEILAFPGTWDLYAEGFDSAAGERAQIQRGVVVDETTSLTVDFDADSFTYESRPIAVTGALDRLTTYSYGFLSGATPFVGRWGGAGDDLWVLPDDVVELGDDLRVFAYTDDAAGAYTGVEIELGSGPIEVELPDPIDEVTFDGNDVRWTDDGAWDRARMYGASDHPDPFVEWSFEDPDADGELLAPDPTTIEGWPDEWALETTGERELALERDLPDGVASAGFGTNIPDQLSSAPSAIQSRRSCCSSSLR